MKVTILTPTKTLEEGTAFYKSKEWKDLRKAFLSEQTDLTCVCCGIGVVNVPKLVDIPEFEGKELANVDHILPVRHYWEERLNPLNLQLLCKSCNKLKGNRHGDNILDDIRAEVRIQREEKQLKIDKEKRYLDWREANLELAMSIEEDAGFEYNTRSMYSEPMSKERFIKEKAMTFSEALYADPEKYKRKVEHIQNVHRKKKNKNKSIQQKLVKKTNTLVTKPIETKPMPRVHLVPKGTMTKST